MTRIKHNQSGGSILNDDTEDRYRRLRAREKQALRVCFGVSVAEPSHEQQMQRRDPELNQDLANMQQIKSRPDLSEKQQYDGFSKPEMSSYPPDSPEARIEFENAQREQHQLKMQMNLANSPKFNPRFRPPGMG